MYTYPNVCNINKSIKIFSYINFFNHEKLAINTLKCGHTDIRILVYSF